MPFDPKTLPLSVSLAFKQGPLAWMLVVEKARQAGIRDLTKVTDIVFYLHYPDRIGRPLAASETKLINIWKGFRTLISTYLDSKASGGTGAQFQKDLGKYNRMFEMY